MIRIELQLAQIEQPVGTVLEAVRACRDGGELHLEDAEALLVILDELMINIVNYASASYVVVSVELVDSEIRLEIVDDGIPFDPLLLEGPNLDIPIEAREVGGMGVLLVKSLTLDQHYEREQDKNRLVLRRRLSI